jgi:hypothetical protein
MASDPDPKQLEALLDRWQTSLDLHARYAALDEARYWHVQPWPKHERPQRWIIQLARKRLLALKRLVTSRRNEGDVAFLESVEAMGFLATLVGITSVERYIPLATHETERREILEAEPDPADATPGPPPGPAAEPVRPRTATTSRTGEHKRTAETTRQMPALASSRSRLAAALAKSAPPPAAAPPRREVRRDAQRPATIKPKKAPSTITQAEHVVIADAVRLLGWGRQWHELAEMISRLSERPAPSEIRRILRTYREHIDAIVTRRRD